MKKFANTFLVLNARRNSDIAMLAINTFRKNCADDSPIVRGVSLRSFCSLSLSQAMEHFPPILLSALQDKNAYVRSVAIYSFLEHSSAEGSFPAHMVEIIKSMAHEHDKDVCCHALNALQKIKISSPSSAKECDLEDELFSSRRLALNHLAKMKDYSDWQRASVIEPLSRNEINDEEEIYSTMNLLEEFIRSNNSHLIISIADYFFALARADSAFLKQVCQRVTGPLLLLLAHSSNELKYGVLLCLQILAKVDPDVMREHYTAFYCKYSEPTYIKCLKLSTLSYLLSRENICEIASEIAHSIQEARTQPVVWKSCFDLLGKAYKFLGEDGNETEEGPCERSLKTTLLCLLKRCRSPFFTSLMVEFLSRAMPYINEEDYAELVLPVVTGEYARQCINHKEFIIGASVIMKLYPCLIPNAPYILYYLVKNHKKSDYRTRVELLQSAMALMKHEPAQAIESLRILLKSEISNSTNPCLRDRALLYYRLLQQSPSYCQNREPFSSRYDNHSKFDISSVPTHTIRDTDAVSSHRRLG